MMLLRLTDQAHPLTSVIGDEQGTVVAEWETDGIKHVAVIFEQYGGEVQLPLSSFSAA